MNIFENRNSGIDTEGNIYFSLNNEKRTQPFPYTLESFLEEIKKMNFYKIGKESDLNIDLENNALPFSIVWDMFTYYYKRIPTYQEFIEQYKKTYCENTNGFFKFKDCYEVVPFTFSYYALSVRIYKIYFSFVREYYVYLKAKEKNLNAFINRKDDFTDRIDVGIINNDVLFILDTSLDSERSNNFEENKTTTRRTNEDNKNPNEALDIASKKLVAKYNCKYYVRILMKAHIEPQEEFFNIKNVGKFKLYDDNYIDLILFYIKNKKINENKIISGDFFIEYYKEKEHTKKFF